MHFNKDLFTGSRIKVKKEKKKNIITSTSHPRQTLEPGSSPKSECRLTHKPQSCQANQQHQTQSQQDQGHWTPSGRGTPGLCRGQKKRHSSSSWIYVSSKLVRGVGSRKEQNVQDNSIQGPDNIPSVLGNTVTRLHAKPHLPRLASFTSPTHSYPPHPPSPTLH